MATNRFQAVLRSHERLLHLLRDPLALLIPVSVTDEEEDEDVEQVAAHLPHDLGHLLLLLTQLPGATQLPLARRLGRGTPFVLALLEFRFFSKFDY